MAADAHRHAPLPPRAGTRLEDAGDCGIAIVATEVPVEPPGGDFVPVASDQALAAPRTIGALARLIMDVAGVDEIQLDLDGRIAGQLRRLGLSTP